MDDRPAQVGGYAADVAANGAAVATAWVGSDWAEEQLFGHRTYNAAGHWALQEGRIERDFLALLGKTRYRLYLAHDSHQRDAVDFGSDPRVLAESSTQFQDPGISVRGDRVAVAWGEKIAGSYGLRVLCEAEPEEVPAAGPVLTPPSSAIDADGRVWVAWQTFHGGICQVAVSRRDPHGWSTPMVVSQPGDSSWRPVLAADHAGGIWVAWDSWLGHHFHVFVRHLDGNGGLAAPLQLSDQPLLAMNASMAVAPDSSVWVAWEQARPWGANHRFAEDRVLVVAGVDRQGVPFQPQSPWTGGQVPIPSVSFTHSASPEYVVPTAPRILAAADEITLCFRRFRSQDEKDFGWTVERTLYRGSQWSEPELLPVGTGMPDTRYGVAALPDRSLLLAANVADYAPVRTAADRAAGKPAARRGSMPVHSERIEIVHVAAGAASQTAASTPTQLPLKNYEGNRADTPRMRPSQQTMQVDGRTLTLFWGDMHRHSHLSKCMAANDGSPLDNFRWALDHNAMDFWALTEHLEYLSYHEWRRVEETVAAFTDAGRFEPLFAFEWGMVPGHTNIFYREQELGEELRALTLMSGSLEELMERWDKRIPPGQVIAARHFQGHRQPDVYAGYRADWEPCMEIMQSRGEQRGWIETFLSRGAKVGFLGATDHARHWHFAYCMTGVWAEDATRGAIFDAVRARRTIAASAKIMLHTDVSGVAMGEAAAIGVAPVVHVVADSATPIRQLEVYRDGQLVVSTEPNEAQLDWRWQDPQPLVAEHYYYVRVAAAPVLSQASPAVAYASPTWVRPV